MHPYIKKLQSKPHHVKKRIITLALIVSMSLVSLVWFYNLNDRLGDGKLTEKSRDDVKPFSMLGESMSNTVKNISASVGNISNIKDQLNKN